MICCDELLYEEDDTVQIIDTEDKTEAHLYGSYHALANIFQNFAYIRQIEYGDDISWCVQSCSGIFDTTTTLSYSDDCERKRYKFYHPYDPRNTLNDPRFPIDEGFYIWRIIYKAIIEANNIIVQIHPNSELSKVCREMIGEAYFIRAYCYFRLLRLFGRIPLVVDVDVNYALDKPNYREIYNFIILDLQKASSLLPLSNDEARIPFVTPCKGAAKALLAEVYLSMAGYPLNEHELYSMAAFIAGEVIDSAEYFGFELLPDFADLWTNSVTANNETIFPIYISDEYILAQYGYNKLYSFNWGASYMLFKILSSQNYSLYGFYPETDAVPEIQFYNTFPPSYRKDETFNTHQFLGFAITDEKKVIKIDTTMDQIPWYFGNLYFKKLPYQKIISNIDPAFSIDGYFYLSEFNNNNPPFITETEANRKFYLIRYAHTLLTYAEAKARSGQLDASAYEAVNMIRRRANKANIYSSSVYDLPSGLSAEQFADTVVWERAWEFAGEPEGRWFDLVRLEMAEDLPQLRHPREITPPEYPVAKEDYFMTIPDEDIWLNPNLE